MRNLITTFVLILSFNITAHAINISVKDSVILKGRVVNFENKKSVGGFAAVYENSIVSKERLTDIDIDTLLIVAIAEVDINGNFKAKLKQGEYIVRLHTPLTEYITLNISLKEDDVDLGTYDLFSSVYYLDEEPAMTALRQRVYDRIMQYRKDGNPTRFNILNKDQIADNHIETKSKYSDFNSNSEIISYYTSGAIVITNNHPADRDKSKKKMCRYLIKMRKKYSKIEEKYFKEAVSKEI